MSASTVTETGVFQTSGETGGGGIGGHHQGQEYYGQLYVSSSGISEIEEEGSSEIPTEVKELFGVREFVPMPSIREEHDSSITPALSSSFDVVHGGEDSVYVAVGKSESSMDALTWSLKHASSSTMVYLIHIFPEIRLIPSPLGKLPVNQVSPEQVKNYMAQEEKKRRELLLKFLAACSAAKVKVDTIVIESDTVAKAILDLIPILNMRKLIVGTSKSSLRKLRSRRRSGIADQILKSAPESCKINIICEGNEVTIDQQAFVEYSSPSPRGINAEDSKSMPEENQRDESFSCKCFTSKFL
ncbi:hypothetical protein FNV43_RR07995 [Rhamnella rubrinervis]|uniref:Uncharacterized protein n=1 Tax=Rhamnella rubrinervis TaxID=2594499 RepID=A0A8K0HGT2_9ROSA|nr:hypothetical protein FNV43_RR07995 [Rhamnella rubrinervis]